MGLLEKALHGAEPPLRSSHAGGKLPSPKAEAPRPPRESPPLPLEDLRALARELHAQKPAADNLLNAFLRVSEVLPQGSFALFLPSGDHLLLAAARGFEAGPRSRIDPSLASSLGSPGAVFPATALAELREALACPSSAPLRGVAIASPANPQPHGLWVFSHPGSTDFKPAEASLLGDLLAAGAQEDIFPIRIGGASEDPCPELLGEIHPDHVAVAMTFDIQPLADRSRRILPGLQEGVVESFIRSAASALLSSRGKALLVGKSRVALLLGSLFPIDPELALFQFRKSLSRSLPLIAGQDFPRGEAYSIDPIEAGCAEALARFITS